MIGLKPASEALLQCAANVSNGSWLRDNALTPPATVHDPVNVSWVRDGARSRQTLREENDIVVHCKGGQGRAGLIVARLLVELGIDPEEAIRSVRAVRAGAIKNPRSGGRGEAHKTDTVNWRIRMDWFERLTGFRESDYVSTRAKLSVHSGRLTSLVNGKNYSTGQLELPSLADLRKQTKLGRRAGRLRVSLINGDVREIHRRPEFAGALFQVASQFNLLEMIGPSKTPEDGVTIYQNDRTQGPACAIAAGAATIYRNYFARVGDQSGQTRERQLDALSDLGVALKQRLSGDVGELWSMTNGYALCNRAGLDAITALLENSAPSEADELRGMLRIGIHRDVEVTDADQPFPILSHAFCSALPVAYSRVSQQHWSSFATLILEAAYEATLLAAILNALRGGSRIVLLTSLGGGAFGNDESWIEKSLMRALKLASGSDLDVRLVSYGKPSPAFCRAADAFS